MAQCQTLFLGNIDYACLESPDQLSNYTCKDCLYFPGWAMQVACFVFIQRRWENDKKHMGNMLDYFCDIKEPLQLLLFPEGTDLTGER